jgi:hypothetical protein
VSASFDVRARPDQPRKRRVQTSAVGKTEVIRWTSKDGKEIEGLLTYPVVIKPDRKSL